MAERLEVRARLVGRYHATVRARDHVIEVDEPPTAGGTDRGMMPTEVFCAALASCFALAVGYVARKRDLEAPGLEVVVEAERAGTELRYGRIVVTTTAALAPEVLATLVERARRVCWVSNTLAGDAAVEYRFTSLDGR